MEPNGPGVQAEGGRRPAAGQGTPQPPGRLRALVCRVLDPRPDQPARLVFGAVVAAMGLVLLVQVLCDRPLLWVYMRLGLGFDLRAPHLAGRALAEGRSPYEVEEFCTPPLHAALMRLLAGVSFEALVTGGVIVTLAAVAAALVVAARTSLGRTPEAARVLLLAVGVTAFSYPFHMLLSRLNEEGVQALLLVGAVALLGWAPYAGGALLGVAAGLKIYPALLVVPLVLQRRRAALLGFGAAALAAIVPLYRLWWVYLGGRLLERTDEFTPEENGSLVATLFHGARMLGVAHPSQRTLRVAAYTLWLLLLAAAVLGDWLNLEPLAAARDTELLLYLPFMLVVPAAAYHYETYLVVLLLPALCAMWARTPERRPLLVLLAAGIALSQVQGPAFAQLLHVPSAHGLPGLGLLVVLVGIVIWKLHGAGSARLSRP